MQFFFFGMWSSLYAYTPEIFPTRARATGCGTASGVGRIGALIGPYLVPVVISGRGQRPGVHARRRLLRPRRGGDRALLGPETRQKVLEEVSG